MLVPPEDLKSLPRSGVEMVFVVDTSGSMSGWPIDQAKKAVDAALRKMGPADTFQVVKFAQGAELMSPHPMAVNEANIAAARQYVARMEGDGPTEMLQGMNAALDFPHDENRTRVVTFLTDGYIGNEMQILKALHAKLQDSRVLFLWHRHVGQSLPAGLDGHDRPRQRILPVGQRASRARDGGLF